MSKYNVTKAPIRYITKEQLEFLVEFGFVTGIDPSLITQKRNIFIGIEKLNHKSYHFCQVRTPKITQDGKADKWTDILEMNIEAAVVFIKEFKEQIKPITDMKCRETREFFASGEPLRVLKALYENDKTKSYLKDLVDPEHEVSLAM
ncbi:hypothetical protein N7335_02025 [Stutzerimonas stutzeri]|uniref:Uncharacterized protein n=1 Tax=Stutzerimonas stutzeri TaxID=316 RepID=A0AA42HCL3_STUST|nr:hypothetical protein [Stutzerimonas stutzeri]MDH0145164.1 hypothetical protein [Stutzerimonas stutzeri]MDH0149581.1 hypothetical protein [Stutzerimonas stutzeri]